MNVLGFLKLCACMCVWVREREGGGGEERLWIRVSENMFVWISVLEYLCVSVLLCVYVCVCLETLTMCSEQSHWNTEVKAHSTKCPIHWEREREENRNTVLVFTFILAKCRNFSHLLSLIQSSIYTVTLFTADNHPPLKTCTVCIFSALSCTLYTQYVFCSIIISVQCHYH